MPEIHAQCECADSQRRLNFPLHLFRGSGPFQDDTLTMRNEIRSQLQQLCGYPLPDKWLHLLCHYPSALLSAGRGTDDQPDEGTVSQVELLADDSAILQINLEARAETWLDPRGNAFTWPPSHLVIGETGDGDYYCIDAAAAAPAVLQYRSQPVIFESAADSLDEFVEMLLVAFTEDEADFTEDPADLSEFPETESDECTDQHSRP